MSETAEVMEEELEISEETSEENTTVWPDSWREQIAGDDEKELKQLGRYKNPADIWTKARALEQKLSSGEYKQVTPFPDKGSDEEKAEWRKSNGLPDDPAKYDLGRTIEDEDKEVLNGFLDFAHTKNMPQSNVQAMVEWFYTKRDQDIEATTEADKALHAEMEDKLRAEWGGDYRGYMNRIESLVDTAPEEIKESFMDARLPDGSKIRDNTAAMQFLLDLALTANPVVTLVPGAADQESAIQDEIDQIKEVMKTDRKKYNNDTKMQERYRTLLGALEKGKK